MFNTTDSPPKSEGGSATGNLHRKVQAHIKKMRDRKKLHRMSSLLDSIIRLERPHR